MLSDPQTGLPGSPTLGEKAISIADMFIRGISVEGSSSISSTITNKNRLNRILHEFESLWPDEGSNYCLGLSFGRGDIMPLNPSHKHILQEMLSGDSERFEKTIYGRLMEVRVDKKRTFQVDTSEGTVTCIYAQELEDEVVENIGRLVRIRGIMALERRGKYSLCLDTEKALESMDMLPLDRVRIKGEPLSLKDPIMLNVSYEDDSYCIVNDKFHLQAFGPNLKAAIEDINDEIETLWENYVEADQKELSKDALNFRDELISAFGGEKAEFDI